MSSIITSIKILFLVAVFSVSSLALATAQIVEVPLPEFLGDYPVGEIGYHSTTFVFNMDPANIRSVSVRVSGTVATGLFHCGPGEDQVWPLQLGFICSDYDLLEYWQALPAEHFDDGMFSCTLKFESTGAMSPTWNMFGDGTAEISMIAGPTWLLEHCTGTETPTATITEVVVILDMESLIPVQESRWGAVKALYK